MPVGIVKEPKRSDVLCLGHLLALCTFWRVVLIDKLDPARSAGICIFLEEDVTPDVAYRFIAVFYLNNNVCLPSGTLFNLEFLDSYLLWYYWM